MQVTLLKNPSKIFTTLNSFLEHLHATSPYNPVQTLSNKQAMRILKLIS